MADAAGMRPHEMITGINLANTLLHAGQMDAAADVASSTLDIAQSLEHEPNAGFLHASAAACSGVKGRERPRCPRLGLDRRPVSGGSIYFADEYPLLADLLDEAADAARRFRRA